MNKYIGPVQRALQSNIPDYVKIVEEYGVEQGLNIIHGRAMINTEIGKVVASLYQDAARMAEKTFRISKSAPVINMFSFVQSVIRYFSKYLLQMVVLPISMTTKDQIERILKQAIKEGWGVEKTVSKIKDPDLTRYRARMIVRTESVRAMNYAQLKAADNAKYQTEKQWIAIEDKRTRVSHSHFGVDGERRDLYDQFSNGLLFPGDPDGPPEETINCRCTLGYFLKTDLEGNYVPKNNLTNVPEPT
jgi:SPP1 gp7 family putative phage head morphogenesis protein